MFTGPKIIKGDGALGALGANEDNIIGFVCTGTLPPTGTYDAFGKSVKLIQASDADALGFDAAYDANTEALVRYHIDEFFRINPEGTLWFMLAEIGTSMTDICDKDNDYIQKLIADSSRKVKSIGVALNIDDDYDADTTDGIDADVLTAAVKAQQLVEDWANRNVFIDLIVIEGRELVDVSADWADGRELDCKNVHIAVLQDYDVAELNPLFKHHAAVGTLLGGIGVRRVEEDLGSLNAANNPRAGAANFPINDAAEGRWLNPAISSHKLCKDLTAPEVELLNKNALIFADSYPEYPGVYFSGSPACVALESDYAYGVNTRVWGKAARIAVFKLTPKINSTVEVSGGKIKATTILSWEADVNNSQNGLSSMVTAGHCTKATTFIDPNQDVLAESKVKVKMKIVPYGYAREIEGELGFSRG